MVYQKHVDIFVVNNESQKWLDGERFHTYLLKNKDILEEYRVLKESLSGKSTREYYTAKTEFINKVLEIA